MVVWGSPCWSNACEQLLPRTKSSGLFGIGFLVLVGGLSFAGCRNAQNLSSDSVKPDVVSSTPPFATKEPDRYQATRTITFTETVTAPNPVNETRTTTVLIMRDGEQRREEHKGGSVGSIVYLELAAGRFVLLPRERLYADLSSEASDNGLSNPQLELDEVSPDLLLNESVPSSHYEKLGEEAIAGRPTTKYRVSKAGSVETIKSETLIWIDEALGMPIKSESTFIDSDRTTKLLMELRDVRAEVSPESFSLPRDYQKVAASVISEKIRQAANQSVLTPLKK